MLLHCLQYPGIRLFGKSIWEWLLIEFHKQGIKAERQKPIKVFYDSLQVGEYFADIIVEDNIIIELKAAEYLIEEHELQLINYLKATDKKIGLLLNFGKKPEFKRKIFTNDRKIIEHGWHKNRTRIL